MSTEREKVYATNVAKTAWSWIISTVPPSVPMSWGISKFGAGYFHNADGYKLPGLVLRVSGLLHTGLVIVALNEGMDLYEVLLMDENSKKVGEWHTGVYGDSLARLIDSLVERSSSMTDEEYARLSSADSARKMTQENEA